MFNQRVKHKSDKNNALFVLKLKTFWKGLNIQQPFPHSLGMVSLFLYL